MKRLGSGSFESGVHVSAKGDINGITGHVDSDLSGVLRNPATINSAVTISTNGSLTVNGTLVIV